MLAMFEKARVQAETLIAEKRWPVQRKKDALEQGSKEADQEAERIILEAHVNAGDCEAQCMARRGKMVRPVAKYM